MNTGRRDANAQRGHDGAGRHQDKQRKRTALIALVTALILASSSFTALGIWQLYRLQWKLALIERVEKRIHAPPEAAPGTAQWTTVSATRDEYRHVHLRGRFLANHDTLTKALTEFGSGFWLLTPFQQTDGSIVLINRGFVPENWQDGAIPSSTEIIGLLRISEPGGGFLRHNDPANARWYSRDVAAIAAAQQLSPVAPYFVDADASPGTDKSVVSPKGATLASGANSRWPRAGLTVTRFSNNHLGYALTWFVLALMSAAAAIYLLRDWHQSKAGLDDAREEKPV